MSSRLVLFLLLLASLHPPFLRAAEGDTITSAGILAQATDWGCLAWQPVGICLWMTCDLDGCAFDVSVKVRHNLPDAVVSAYKNTGENPWVDVAAFSPPNALAQDGGSNTEGASSHHEQALRFKNTDAIGSPASALYAALAAGSDLICPPGSRAYFPYYLSVLDIAWREPTIETPLTFTYFLHRVGRGATQFGPLYPRSGFVHQGHDYKSAVVNGVRTADIITQRYQPHVYVPLLAASRPGYWPPGEGGEVLWQQLVPGGTPGCRVLPDIDDTFFITDPYRDRVNQSTGYAWHLWRTYRCCERRGDILVYHTGG